MKTEAKYVIILYSEDQAKYVLIFYGLSVILPYGRLLYMQSAWLIVHIGKSTRSYI